MLKLEEWLSPNHWRYYQFFKINDFDFFVLSFSILLIFNIYPICEVSWLNKN
ncbi:hypothetical protein NSP_15120 [Nodularia spumigena CCY9414]|nr:hypothetical protein NSP_15120 [Nodularia spumigena CCY9414]